MAVPSLIEEWAASNPQSEAAHEEALRVLVDGVTQDVRAEPPFPVRIVGASGPVVTTADGDELICYVMGHGSLLLGHQPAPVVEAVRQQAEVAFHYGGSHLAEAEWASRILDMFPHADRVRFTSSGTESTMLACRIARAHTGRDVIVKLNGHFHGWHDSVLRGFTVPFDRPFAGLPSDVFDRTISIEPDPEALQRVLETGEVAAVMIEPAGGYSGAVPFPVEFLQQARDLCDRTESLLIFDEVVTGFRWAPGGAQETTGIRADITTLGKIVAGGLPGGAVIGGQEIMASLSVSKGNDKVIHTGTHNGHPLAAVAGSVTLDLIRDGAAQNAAAKACGALIDGFNEVFRRHGVPGLAYGASSHFCLIVGVPEVEGVTDASTLGSEVLRRGTPPDILAALNCAMMLNGVHLFHGHGFVASVHDEQITAETIEALDRSVGRLVDDGVL